MYVVWCEVGIVSDTECKNMMLILTHSHTHTYTHYLYKLTFDVDAVICVFHCFIAAFRAKISVGTVAVRV
jgi:hypothetical protein